MPASKDILARNLRAIRFALGITQEEFADMAGSGRTYVGAIERGEENPTLERLDAYAACLGLEARELLDTDVDGVIQLIRERRPRLFDRSKF